MNRLAAAVMFVAAPPAATPAPRSPVPALENVMEIAGPAGPLKGTMLAPGGRAPPAALIIPGSGPTDRNGNNPLGIKASTYRLLAEGLAQRGIASLRIDKRGMFESRAAIPDANAVTIADYAGDVRNWVSAVRKRTGVRCVWLVGHSEGGIVALAAAKGATDICGLVLVATPGRPLGQILREQLKANPANAPLLGQAMAAIDRLEAGRRVADADLHPALQPLFGSRVQGFVIDLMAHDPAKLVAATSQPVLILQGGRDIQVGEHDARRLAAANAKARLVLVPLANHVLKSVATDDRAANAATYADPNLPLAPGIVEAVAAFIAPGRPGARKP